ncbi:MAG: hypothetical protein LBR68_04820, partial [Lachnoclostridium sp.]|nr:hypothetical protein [Lachnoclostridium sp.]
MTELKESAAALVKIEIEYVALKSLSDTANGKLDFETYAQTAYFERVLRSANLRLKMMSQNRYILLRRGERRRPETNRTRNRGRRQLYRQKSQREQPFRRRIVHGVVIARAWLI